MKVKQREVYGAVVLDLQGKLTGGPEAETFREIFKGLVQDGKLNIIVNLRKVDWINSTGLGILISNYTTVKNAGGNLALVHVADRIENILYVTKLHLLFKTFDNEEEAVKSFAEAKE